MNSLSSSPDTNKMEWNFLKPWDTLDDFQKKVLETKGNITLRSGRQVGKSTIISIKVGDFAMNNKNKEVLVIASVERQAFHLFDKILNYIMTINKNLIKKGKDRPTKSKIKLKNGSIIRCLPTGLTGHGIRGFTIDLLIADEAAFIPQEVWAAVTPMLAVTKGDIILLSTPFGRQGYFYRSFSDDSFTKFHLSSEDCPRIDKDYLQRERERMTKLQYSQEYLGEFIDEILQYFPTELVKKVCRLRPEVRVNRKRKYYLGVDVARMGTDETTFEIIDATNKNQLIHVYHEKTTKTLTTDSVKKILVLDKIYKFKKIYIDDAGLGSGVFDPLLEHKQTKRRVIAINNAKRSIDKEDRRKKLLKEDLYNNLLYLMERDKIALIEDDDIILSLRSVQYEYTGDEKGRKSLRIYGNYTHIVEGIIRAAWAYRDKSLNIWIGYS